MFRTNFAGCYAGCWGVTYHLQALSPLHHNNPTFASRWQMVFYTGSASHVALSDRVSVSLRSSMHIKIDMAFLVVPRLVHPFCFFSSFAPSLFFTHSSHLCACLWPDKERCMCLKEFLNLSFPVRKAGGVRSSISTAHGIFGAFLFVIVLYLCELKRRTRPASSYGHVESLHVSSFWNLLIKPTVHALLGKLQQFNHYCRLGGTLLVYQHEPPWWWCIT